MPTSPQRFAVEVNLFTRQQPSPYLNSHRPGYIASEARDAKGRLR